ncbi:hypothetical protein XENTR_v10008891 [Xenopus tropicalis]|nr:hypothetical protein XENTR_v10008891 [Xenopus tropicalis]
MQWLIKSHIHVVENTAPSAIIILAMGYVVFLYFGKPYWIRQTLLACSSYCSTVANKRCYSSAGAVRHSISFVWPKAKLSSRGTSTSSIHMCQFSRFFLNCVESVTQ